MGRTVTRSVILRKWHEDVLDPEDEEISDRISRAMSQIEAGTREKSGGKARIGSGSSREIIYALGKFLKRQHL
jgi:hypothetical protein